MKSKQQLHLKTISFEQPHHNYTKINSEATLKVKRGSTQARLIPTFEKKNIVPYHKMKKSSTQITPNSTNLEIITRFNQLQINRQSLRGFSNTKKDIIFRQSSQFPKRQPILRNTNAFKYFLSSAINKIPTGQVNYLDEFMKKITHAIGEQPIKQPPIIQKPKRSITQILSSSRPCSKKKRTTRPQTSSSNQMRTTAKTMHVNLQPWETAYEEEHVLTINDM